MITDYNGETYEFPDHNLNHLDYRDLNRKLQSEITSSILTT